MDAASAVWYDQSAGVDVAWTNGDTAVFEGQPGQVSVSAQSGPVAVGGIAVNVDGYSLSCDSLSLSSATTTIDVASGATATISVALVGDGGLAKTDAGTLILSGANSYAGASTLVTGVLQFAAGSLPINAATPNIAFAGGTLQWAADNTDDISAGMAPIPAGQSAILDTKGNDVIFSTPLSGDGGLIKLGDGTLFLAADNTYGGPTVTEGGSLQIAGEINPPCNILTPQDGISPLAPQDINAAYGINQLLNATPTNWNGSGQTIAIVDAYDDPDLVDSTDPNFVNSDLAAFDAQFDLPAPPSFQKLNENGGTSLPVDANGQAGNWAIEIPLDVEWAHAIAPEANIVLFEASNGSGSPTDLLTAVNTAHITRGFPSFR